ncbi:Pex19 protein [Russula aff. rugulosa BPL654]|nr:Pex19 protein [Russula aff. rugulosa BPL654]
MTPPTSNDRGKHPVCVDDDSDVDDLDDILDDFTPNSSAKPVPQTTATNKTAQEFARQMEAMLRDLSIPEDSSTADNPGPTAWEEVLIKSMDDALSGVSDGAKSNAAGDSEDAFQKSLREATERLHRSDTELQADSQAGDDELAALLESGDDGELQKLLEGMMGQLMSKEVLYEPLKELNDKFPSYLASNRDKLSASDMARYEAQRACASQIIEVFNDTGYRDDNPEMTTKIIALMNKMQEHGAPPAEIMGELPPGLDLGPDGAPQLPAECLIM